MGVHAHHSEFLASVKRISPTGVGSYCPVSGQFFKRNSYKDDCISRFGTVILSSLTCFRVIDTAGKILPPSDTGLISTGQGRQFHLDPLLFPDGGCQCHVTLFKIIGVAAIVVKTLRIGHLSRLKTVIGKGAVNCRSLCAICQSASSRNKGFSEDLPHLSPIMVQTRFYNRMAVHPGKRQQSGIDTPFCFSSETMF